MRRLVISCRHVVRWLFLLAIACFFTAQTAAGLSGTVQVVTFTGPVTSQLVTFSLYLPPGYSTNANRYPVVIHLHGIGGSHAGAQTNLVPASLETAVTNGLVEPCIVVFPNGYTDSFWADGFDGSKPAETNVRSEIIPYVDANYRTIPERRRRVIQGFSMGGFGAAKFATKFPELFVACVVYDGAMLNWTQIQQRHALQAQEIFNNNAATFDQFSPWYWLAENADTLGQAMPFRDSVGSLTNENRAWRDALMAEGITPSYVETGAPHAVSPLLDAEGANSWAFIQGAFDAADAETFRVTIAKLGNDALLQWPAINGGNYQVERKVELAVPNNWQPIATNISSAGAIGTFVHSNAFAGQFAWYRVRAETNSPPPSGFTFNWTGTNFTYSDNVRSFTGIMLKPTGSGPFPAVIINHGAGGSVANYSLGKAREISPWGMVTIAPTLTHVAGGETNSVNMGFCSENLARIHACLNVLRSLNYVDSERVAIFGHSMGAYATIGSAAFLTNGLRAGAITAGGIIPDAAGTNNAAPTVSETSPIQTPFLMIHCDADTVVPVSRSQLFQQLLNTNSIVNQRIVISSNSIPNTNHWHNIHQDTAANTIVLTNLYLWFQSRGVLP